MNNVEENSLTKEEYNKIPVYYCKHCMSLHIKTIAMNIDYCEDCGSTNIDSTDIETWKNLSNNKYNI